MRVDTGHRNKFKAVNSNLLYFHIVDNFDANAPFRVALKGDI